MSALPEDISELLGDCKLPEPADATTLVGTNAPINGSSRRVRHSPRLTPLSNPAAFDRSMSDSPPTSGKTPPLFRSGSEVRLSRSPINMSKSPKLTRHSSSPGFAGSFVESLMSGRIQAKPNVVHGFCLTMRAMGKSAVYTLPIRVPFSATFYDFRDDDFVSRSCPYVARVEISDPIPVPPVGMLNITIANPSGTPVRMLMVNYDCAEQPVDTKAVIRYKASSKEGVVKYVVQCSIARTVPTTVFVHDSPGRKAKGHFLCNELRLCFPSAQHEDSDELVESYDVPAAGMRYYPMSPAPSAASAAHNARRSRSGSDITLTTDNVAGRSKSPAALRHSSSSGHAGNGSSNGTSHTNGHGNGNLVSKHSSTPPASWISSAPLHVTPPALESLPPPMLSRGHSGDSSSESTSSVASAISGSAERTASIVARKLLLDSEAIPP